MRTLITLLFCTVLCMPGASVDQADSPDSKPAAAGDPAATAEWLSQIFTVKDGKALVAGKEAGKYHEALLRFSKPVEILPQGDLIIADQEGLYPMIIGPASHGYGCRIYTPFYALMDMITESDGLPRYAPHPKATAINGKGLRIIAKRLHAHFTRGAGAKPECRRVLDHIGYASEHYIWTVGKSFIILSAYDGNDNDGIRLDITDNTESIGRIRRMPETTAEVFEEWGDSMPDLSKTGPK
ncbi:MAG: hypothetical protein EOP86_15995 [Verrucomicrobiaceae bacterium]|nr:MAG: hypothetical protein EOP86_15995 [Verrucomicrobiaceae bacterium]